VEIPVGRADGNLDTSSRPFDEWGLFRVSRSPLTATARVVRLSIRPSHSAARQAIIVRMSTGRSARANAVAATGSPSRHMVMKRAATVAAHRETIRANRRLTLPSSLPASNPRSLFCCAARPCVLATVAHSVNARPARCIALPGFYWETVLVERQWETKVGIERGVACLKTWL
jgi:hypothetical protein